MKKTIQKFNIASILLLFIGIPLLLYVLGDFPRRTLLKEIISVSTLLAFFMMLSQFFISRSNKGLLLGSKMSTVLNYHKVIGYVFTVILIFHPFLLVVPHYFESGVAPMDAFTTILTTFQSKGIILGMSAWIIMIIIGLTAFFRKNLPMTYKTWRLFHGILSILFVLLASAHVISIGRHASQALSIFIIIVATASILLLLKTYFFKPSKKSTL